jgi:repressor LexA
LLYYFCNSKRYRHADIKLIERGLEKPARPRRSGDGDGRSPGLSRNPVRLRLIKASEIADIIDYLELNSVPIMGRVGAGATIEPEYEQVPPEGLGEVELPFPISEETIAFEVAGDSMLPKYENGDIIVVYKEQRHPLASFYGEEAAVRLKTGERYLKTIERGKSAAMVNLIQLQRKPISGVKLEWIGRSASPCPGARSSACGQGRRPGTQGGKIPCRARAREIEGLSKPEGGAARFSPAARAHWGWRASSSVLRICNLTIF